MNKKGNIAGIVIFMVILFVILFLGFVMVVGSAVVNWTFDTVVPEVTNMGTQEGVNLTRAAALTIVPLNNILQQFTWLTGVLYVMALIGSVGFAFVARISPNKWLIGFYFLCVIILIMGAIFMSNMYEEFYNDTGELGDRLQEHILLSYMVLHSPVIMTVIAFLTGIVMFSGMQQEEFI